MTPSTYAGRATGVAEAGQHGRCCRYELGVNGGTISSSLRLLASSASPGTRMLHLDFDAVSLTQTEVDVLGAYADAEQALSATRPKQPENEESETQHTTWVGRIQDIEGVPRDQLAPIHGRLIALGLLHFQLQGRDEGVVYRVTPEGRRALSKSHQPAVDESMARLSA